jgi:hypothetical protein
VTLVANEIVVADPTLPACGWKTFYDRLWSAVDAVAAGRTTSNEMHGVVASVLGRTSASLPEKVLFDLRQQESAQLETHTIEHLESFPDRLKRVLTVRVAESVSGLTWKKASALGLSAFTYAVACPSQLERLETGLRGHEGGGEVRPE